MQTQSAAWWPRAEIIAVGSELLTPLRLDTNSLFLTAQLNQIGIEVRGKTVVGDDREDLARVVRDVLARADFVLVTGGLGPTDDDVTRDVVATVLGLSLDEDPVLVERIRRRFRSRGLEMPEINRRQAQVPHGAVPLDNPNGTAPGLWIEQGERVVVLLPGPPRELEPMFQAVVRERLAARAGGRRVVRRVLRVVGRTESHTEEAVQPIYSRWRARQPAIDTTVLAALGQIELHLSVVAADEQEAAAVLDPAVAEVAAVLGADLFSTDGRTLEQVVGHLLRERRWRVAVAESCTGGLITARLTDVPGSSDYIERGFVVYSNDAKVAMLGVPAGLIAEHGAVSEPVALAMAEGARARADVDVAVGVTGIAGPSGGTAQKPVGTVCAAIATARGPARVRTVRFPGGREQVKFHASQLALDLIRREALKGTVD